MKNKLFSYALIWTIFLTTTNVNGVFAQSISKEARKAAGFQKIELIQHNKIKNSWNAPITNVLDAPIDFDKINKESDKPVPHRKMSGKSKAMWVAIAIGAAVGLFFLIKYADPLECEIEAYCSPGEVCQCLKYKDKDKK